MQADQRVQADTDLGPFTVGVSGLSDNERTRATTGDVELGYLYQFQFHSAFPKIAELRPFLFNRAETTDTSYYESLGLGAGIGLSVFDQYEQNNWFVRLSVLTPNDNYRERYALERDQTSIVEVMAGYEVPIGPGSVDREMRRRMAQPSVVRLTVPASLFDMSQTIDPNVLKRVHALIIQAYLSTVSPHVDHDPIQRTGPDPYWQVIRQIERTTSKQMSQMQRYLLLEDLATDPDERATIRREILTQFIRGGLIEMMREHYLLLIQAVPAKVGEVDLKSPSSTPVAIMSLPGVNLKPKNKPLDTDTMIEHYIEAVTAGIK